MTTTDSPDSSDLKKRLEDTVVNITNEKSYTSIFSLLQNYEQSCSMNTYCVYHQFLCLEARFVNQKLFYDVFKKKKKHAGKVF